MRGRLAEELESSGQREYISLTAKLLLMYPVTTLYVNFVTTCEVFYYNHNTTHRVHLYRELICNVIMFK